MLSPFYIAAFTLSALIFSWHEKKTSKMSDPDVVSNVVHRLCLASPGVMVLSAAVKAWLSCLSYLGDNPEPSMMVALPIVGLSMLPLVAMVPLGMFICGTFFPIASVKGWLKHLHNPPGIGKNP